MSGETSVVTTASGDAKPFAADWLALRAPADRRARDGALLSACGAWLRARPAPRVVDLGAGAGATVSALGPLAPADIRWRLVDNDPSLLARAQAGEPSAEIAQADLSGDLAPLLADADLVSASAFLDLVSATWIERFAQALPAGAAVYVALSFDGRLAWSPTAPEDAAVADAFRAHQRRDKGFGPALGGDAAAALAARLTAGGRRVEMAASPWRLARARGDGALIDQLASGVAAAAAEAGAGAAATWASAPKAECEIGHLDLWAAPVPR